MVPSELVMDQDAVMTDRELLIHIHELARKALFERTHRAAAKAALDALSEIDKLTARFK